MAKLIVDISDELHRALKTKCASSGTTIRSTVIDWLKEEVKDQLHEQEGEAYVIEKIKAERKKNSGSDA